jgi:D-alanyl-D-alanine carboxypeptidase
MKKSVLIFCMMFELLLTTSNCFSQSGADSLLTFIGQNKTRSSLSLIVNDSLVGHVNENRMMPLASTAKILIAIEFAKQASYNLVDPGKKIALSELAKYYIPGTDGNAHSSWINYEKQKGNILNDSVSLIEVAKGMIIFSSNANAEYLMDLLGINNINSNIHLLGIKNHTRLYPWVSALFLYGNPKHLKEENIINNVKKLSDDEYAKASMQIHNELKKDSTFKQKLNLNDLTIEAQKEWSDRLPSSTTKEYARLCNILDNRQIFDKKTYDILSELLETMMQNPENQTWLSHAGMKGGSTIFVLTKALYATLKNGTRIELAYFFNDLTQEENDRLQKWMNDFELQILRDENFRKKVEAV